MPYTLKEIAKRSEVSTATVSRVLNGRPGVAPKVRERVLALVREMNAETGLDFRNHPPSANSAIAFVVYFQPDSDNPNKFTPPYNFYSKVMLGAEQELSSHGYHVVSSSIAEEHLADDNRGVPWLSQRRVDGMILCMPEAPGRVISSLVSSGLPSILVSDIRSHSWLDSVTSDDREGGYVATRHLLEHGHRNIACLSGPEEWSVVGNRVQGYRDAMRDAGYEARIQFCRHVNLPSGSTSMPELLTRWPDTTAVFATTDLLAIGASRVASETGRRLPDDLAIIGYDDIPWAEYADPPLTTLHIHTEEMGKLAARRLLEILQNGRDVPVHIQVGNELVVRKSCGCNGLSTSKVLDS
jgi:LacI family transcriptional regulator